MLASSLGLAETARINLGIRSSHSWQEDYRNSSMTDLSNRSAPPPLLGARDRPDRRTNGISRESCCEGAITKAGMNSCYGCGVNAHEISWQGIKSCERMGSYGRGMPEWRTQKLKIFFSDSRDILSLFLRNEGPADCKGRDGTHSKQSHGGFSLIMRHVSELVDADLWLAFTDVIIHIFEYIIMWVNPVSWNLHVIPMKWK